MDRKFRISSLSIENIDEIRIDCRNLLQRKNYDFIQYHRILTQLQVGQNNKSSIQFYFYLHKITIFIIRRTKFVDK